MTRPNARLLQLFSILAAWAIVVVLRLVQVQIVRHEHYTNRAARQQERTVSLTPRRGSILDAQGRVLAESVAAESIYADPQAITNRRATAASLAVIPGIGLTRKEIETRLRANGAFVWIARQVSLDVASRVKAAKLPGISTLEEHRRSYPRGTLAANLLGYTGVDGEGLAGIEHSSDEHVRGRAGKVTLLRDARRGVYMLGGEGQNRALDGHSVVLTIDSVIQFIAERALARAVDRYRSKGGVAIIMEPSTGSILAMASSPTFDPNRFRDFPATVWRNRAVQDLYEPGSTFKIVTAAAGLEEGIVTPSQILDCGNGSIQIGNIEIREHDGKVFGMMSFEDVLAHSSNVGTIKVALTVGQQRFYDYIRRFGFGERTGIALPGEVNGLLRRTDRWSQISNASIAIGQEIGTTPLQVVQAVATVANGGVRVQPRIIDRVVDGEGRVIVRPGGVTPTRAISERTAAVLNEMLKTVVSRGTGRSAALPEHVVAGKTGTAQKAARGGYSADDFVASFAGYVPADRPRLAILVVIDEPRGEHYGGVVAAPVFREIAEASMRYLRVPPSIPARSLPLDGWRMAEFSQGEQRSVRRTPSGSVPDLRGLDGRAAIAEATAAGFHVRAAGSGVVTSQKPLPGDVLSTKGLIEIELRAGEGSR